MIKYNTTNPIHNLLFKAFWTYYIAELSQYSERLRNKQTTPTEAVENIKSNPLFKRYFITDEDGTPIGFVLLGFKENTHPNTDWYIAEFFIRPEDRRKGYGRKAAKELLNLHPGRYCYFVLKENTRAKRFWDRIRGELKCTDIKRECPNQDEENDCIFEAFEYYAKTNTEGNTEL